MPTRTLPRLLLSLALLFNLTAARPFTTANQSIPNQQSPSSQSLNHSITRSPISNLKSQIPEIQYPISNSQLPITTYLVTNTADFGPSTLRQAILDANVSPGLDTITFAIGSIGSQQTIALTTALPTITGQVILDGWSQGGGAYIGPPLVEINGNGIPTWNTSDGLNITAGESTVRGLAINYFNIAINLTANGNNIIEGNYLGLALNGDTPIGNRTGMRIAATSDNNRIGTDGDSVNDTAERNVISASGFVQQNNSTGILIDQGSDNHWIAGNFIGTDANGTLDRGNAVNGINTGGIIIIGTNGDGIGDEVEGNLISGNNSNGILLSTTSGGSRVAGNKIGTDVTGTAALPNNSNGVSVGSCSVGQCSDYLIGTDGDGVSDALEGNLISGNGADGVFILSGTLDNNVIAGNKIGTNISGTAAIPNGDYGVHLGGDFSRLGTNNDGISDSLEGNLISGNGNGAGNNNNGVLIPSGADHHLVAGNFIGTNADGTAALPNGQTGLRVEDDFNTVTGNLISGNGENGLTLSDAFFNTVTDNLIGTAVDGLTALGNGLHGVHIATNSDDNSLGAGNVIAFNGGDGVYVDGGTSCGAAFCLRSHIFGNSIFDNGGLGIDLYPNGLTPNDPLDPDTGANALQNYPVLLAATSSGTTLVLTGTLNSTANLTFTLDVYSSSACDPAGAGEGAVYLGVGQVTTDANGDAAFNISVAGLAQDGDAVTATATDPDGNTSEFSACIPNVGEEPIAGLQAFNDSPTFLGLTTDFSVTLTSGTGVSYAWDFGDGATGNGATPAHIFATPGNFTATVTASNSLGSEEAMTTIMILPQPMCAATPDNGVTVFGSVDATALQQAVDTPQAAGNTVKIAGTCAGVSTRDGFTQTVYVENMMSLAGGYTVGNWAAPDPESPSVLDALGLGRVIYAVGAPLTLENLILINGDAAGSGIGSCPDYGCGGGLFTWDNLTLSNVTFQNNQANRGGGAYIAGALLAVDSDWLNNTSTTQRGGGLEVYGDAAITGGQAQGNTAAYAGGLFANARLVITGTQFISNTATSPSVGSGGAVYASGPLNIMNALFQGNQAQTGAGAVLHSPGTPNEYLFITNTQFINNTTLNTSAQGGALYTSAESSKIQFSTFQGNSAPGSSGTGGAIVAFKAITLTETTLISNTVGGQGGAIYHWGLSEPGNTGQIYPLVMINSVFTDNHSGAEGGGLYFRHGFAGINTPIQLFNVTFENNIASLEGGGGYLGQPANISDSLLQNNQSTTAAGGGLYTEDRLSLVQTIFQNNAATRAGGVYVTGDLDIVESDWLDNIGSIQRGGAFEVYGDAVIIGGLVQGNAANYAGGLFANAGLVISGTQFISNTATSPTVGSGGAIYAAGPLGITNALFQGNQSYTGAGAVLHSPGTNEFLSIANTQFINNTTLNPSAQGGALSAFGMTTIFTSTFRGNRAPGSLGAGGAIVAFKAITLTETTLISNTVGGQGGAIYHWGLSEPGNINQIYPFVITNSMLAGNQAGGEGGGLYFRDGWDANNVPIRISHTFFQENIASLDGGGAYLGQPGWVEDSTFRGNVSLNAAGGGLALRSDGVTPSQVSNAVFFSNTAFFSGASLYVNSSASVDILHTTLAGMGTTSGEGITVVEADVQITNAIVVSHTVGIAASGGAVVTADHTLFHANQTDVQGVTNLNPVSGNPQFQDAANGDFHLTLGSPAIDTGTSTSITTDFEADLRPIIAQNDLGADEFGDSAMGDPGSTTTVGGGGIIITIPPGALGGPGNILFLPTFPPTFVPPTPWLPFSPGFQLIIPPLGYAPMEIEPTFLLPITITLTYADPALAGINESTIFLAVYDESIGEWVDATATCAEPSTLIHNPIENQIIVTTCATGEFALMGLGAAGEHRIFLPLITR